MNAREAKELLQPIPNEDFIRSEYSDEIGKCCAIGHLIRLKSEDPSDFSIENCTDLASKFGADYKLGVKIFVRGDVNDFMKKNTISTGVIYPM